MEFLTLFMDALKWFSKPLCDEINYLVHYKKNTKKLKDQATILKEHLDDVNIYVDQAKSRGEPIKNHVEGWVRRATDAQNLNNEIPDVDQAKSRGEPIKNQVEDSEGRATEAQNQNNEIQANENHRCFSACCTPHWLSRYKLSKQAVRIAQEMVDILNDKPSESVSLPVPPPISKPTAPAPTGHFMSFESTTNAMEDVLKALKDDNNANIVGIHGMGGVGKTTMVKQVAEKVMSDGHRVVMATMSQNVNLTKIQDSIADGLQLKFEMKSEEGRAKELREKLMAEKRVLIILDDIWDWIDLSMVGIPFGSDLEHCKPKILLTTRREHVCHAMGCEPNNKIHLNILSPEDSWNLFMKTAGTDLDSTEFEDVAHEVAKECDGLPLALVTVARALGDKDVEEWKKAARRLKRSVSPNPDHQEKVTECIKLSYDYLKDREAKACFLICCLFPEDHNISKEVLARYGMGLRLFQNVDTLDEARGDADTFTKNLIDSALLLRSDEDGFVKMHDVVRDTAKLISSSGNEQLFMAQAGSALQEWPRDTDDRYESYTAVSVMFNNIQRLPDEPVCLKLQTLLLQENSNLKEIPSGFFNRMNTLKVLDISGLQVFSLPPSIGLLHNLCTLYMDRCKSKDISILGGLRKLEILSLKKSLIGNFPEELAELAELRMLDMTSCAHIQTILPKVISRLQGLEELYLQGSFCQWRNIAEGTSEERNASLEEVINLPKLTILKVDIEKVICLPPNVKFIPKWVKFDICISESLFNRLMNVQLSKLKRVYTRILFIDTTMSTLPDWFIEAVTEKAEMLIYSDCQDLMEILTVYDKGRLCGLKSLFVEQCHKVECLIPFEDGIRSKPVFENLQELHIHHMESMKEIWVGQLPPGSFEKLKFLEVQQCSYLENSLLHSNIIQRLQNLEILHVTGNSIKEVFGFEGLQEGRCYLERLKELRLDNLSQLANIWKGPAQLADFKNVKTVIVIKCNKLKYLFSPSMSQGLLQLEELWVEDCSDLGEIIQKDGGITLDKIKLPRLKTLVLQNLAHISNFCDGNCFLECPLEHLHVRDCPNFEISNLDSSKQAHFNDERHYNLLKKRLKEPEDTSNALE